MAEELHQKALSLELKKRFIEAGECWEALGQNEKAVANYHRGGNIKRAIDLALKKGLNKRAAELYAKAEIYDRAADLYRKERDFSNAARAYRQGGMVAEAAVMFETAGEFTEAARVHESVNDFLKAGELYEKGGDLPGSARAYELAIDSNALSRLGGKKDLARVAQVLTKVKNFEKAAQIYIQSEEISEAVLLFVRMGEVEGAARLLANCQSDVGFEVLTHIDYNDTKVALEFARMFYLAHDYGKAARVFESCHEPERAAFLYEKNQDYHQAAEMFAAGQAPLKAAEMFEKAGSYKDAGDYYLRAQAGLRAASCFEAAEDHFQAGKLYFDGGRDDKAVDLLQRVDEGHPRYLEAAAMGAEVLRRKGFVDLAIDRYRATVRGRKCDAFTVDHFYALAELLQGRGGLDEAERLLGELVSFKFGYKDAASRLEEVRRRRTEPAPAVAEAAPVVATFAEAPAAAAAPGVPVQSRAGAPPVAGAETLVTRMDGFDVLSATALFSDLSLLEMKRFWDVSQPRRVAAGEVVFEDGVDGAGLYVIREGSFNVIKSGEILVQLHAGEFFGEMSLIDQSARTSARVEAATAGELFFLDRNAFNRIIAASDGTALKMYRVFVGTLCGRLRRVSDDFATLKSQAGAAELEAPDA